MTMHGANPDELAALGTKLIAQTDVISTLMTEVTTAFGSTTWQGPARDRFEGEWHSSFRPALSRLMTAFDAAGNECKTRATALHQAMAL